MKDEMKIEDYNITEGSSTEMSLRLQGGIKNDKSMVSAGIAEERQVKRRTSEPCSDVCGFEEVKLSDVTAKDRYSIKKIR